MMVAMVIVGVHVAGGALESPSANRQSLLRCAGRILCTAIALAVAAIPDALPAVLSIVLTIGA